MKIEDFGRERILFLGIGNRDRQDDGIGPVLIDLLMTKGFPNVVDAGAVPENYTGRIIEYSPLTLIIFDALNFGGKPGDWNIFRPDELEEEGFSTHTASLSVLCKYINQSIPVSIYILGIQPGSIGEGNGLSAELEQAADALIRQLNKHFNH